MTCCMSNHDGKDLHFYNSFTRAKNAYVIQYGDTASLLDHFATR